MLDSQAFLQRRVAGYLLVLGGFLGLMTLGSWFKLLFFREQLAAQSLVDVMVKGSLEITVVALGVLAGWVFVDRSAPSERALQIAETLGTLALVFPLIHILTLVPTDIVVVAPPEVGILILSMLVLVLRAALVPSSALRTLVVGGLVVVELTGVALLRDGGVDSSLGHHQKLWVYVLTWGLVFTAATVLVSRVIYGLQERVRRALQLGNYTLAAKLGEGGMGEVYLAHHALLQRPTAIKLLPPEKMGETTIKRFEREVREASRLTHPNTVEVYDFGRTPEGLFYYAMEYLDGLNLEELVSVDGPQPPGRVIFVMAQVAHALHHAHDKHLIHRDIKPANIILCNRGGVADMAKVVDFGLVKPIEAPDELALTGSNTVTGTPAYMAPESLTSPEAVDGRADLYALGAVAYFMLTGAPVFDGKTMVEICGHHLHSEPVAPSRRPGATSAPDLERVILRCLAKRPEDRYENGNALREALLACSAAAAWSMETAADWWTRHEDVVNEVAEGKHTPVSHSDTVLVARLTA